MKKRKELDALLGKRCRSYQQLQQNDANVDAPASSSSHDLYFHPATTYRLPAHKSGRSIREKNGSCSLRKCFYFSLPLCLLALIAACITSSVGVVWMQMQLKSDIDLIKDRMLKLERWKNDQTSSLTDIQETLNNLDKGLHKLETGDVRDIQLSLAKLIEQMQDYAAGDLPLLKKSVNKINESITKTRMNLSMLKKEAASSKKSTAGFDVRLAAFTTDLEDMRKNVRTLTTEMRNKASTAGDSFSPREINTSLTRINTKLSTLERSSEEMKQRVLPLATRQDQLSHSVDQLAKQCAVTLNEKPTNDLNIKNSHPANPEPNKRSQPHPKDSSDNLSVG